MDLFTNAHAALIATSVADKLGRVAMLALAQSTGTLRIDRSLAPAAPDSPGRPAAPRLVPPQAVPRRGVGTPAGRAALLHALAHIEFNAIHLALDASVRFTSLPDEYHHDWLGVAIEEARHFSLLTASLERRGYAYGAFDAHNGLWEMALKTRDDPLARMALVPRVLEARGLDVTPGIRARFAEFGDDDAVGILDVILADEIGHVAIGNRWYREFCAERGLDPLTAYTALARERNAPGVHKPLNRAARLAGGFTGEELDALEHDAG